MDKRGTAYGIDKMKLELGTGNAQVCVHGKHANLPVVPLPTTLPLRAQVQTSTGSCFEATFGTATKNDARPGGVGTRLLYSVWTEFALPRNGVPSTP